MTRPFASTGLREITFRTRLPYSCPPWPGEWAGGQRGAFGVIWMLDTDAENDPWITRAWPWPAEAALHLPTARLGYTQVIHLMTEWNVELELLFCRNHGQRAHLYNNSCRKLCNTIPFYNSFCRVMSRKQLYRLFIYKYLGHSDVPLHAFPLAFLYITFKCCRKQLPPN